MNQVEEDNGYVTLVNAKEENGKLTETTERTGLWAWKHPHEDGTTTYTKLILEMWNLKMLHLVMYQKKQSCTI